MSPRAFRQRPISSVVAIGRRTDHPPCHQVCPSTDLSKEASRKRPTVSFCFIQKALLKRKRRSEFSVNILNEWKVE